jgi:Fe-S oxidoreductase
MLELSELVMEVGGETLNVCIQCGTCTGVCPWNLGDEFSPRQLLRLVSLGIEGYEQDSLWKCVTCATCVDRCPRGVDMVDVIRCTRGVMVENGFVPPLFRAPFGRLSSDGNPWGEPRSERTNWAADLDMPTFSPSVEYLFYACCTHAYDARNRKVLKEMASLLLGAGISMGIIGNEESCCGDQVNNCGGVEIFAALKSDNSSLFDSSGVKRIIATSPHCLNTFDKHYPGGYQVRHYTQVLSQAMDRGKIVPRKQVPLRVAYHDPCYLGRHNGIYEEPRHVLGAIPGLETIEFARNRRFSLCCGGGGGGIWTDIEKDKRFSVMRIEAARKAGVEVIATACPFCMIMFEDAIKAMGIDENELRIMDVAELLYQSVE